MVAVDEYVFPCTCLIERATVGAADAMGRPGRTWATVAAGVRCRWDDRRQERVSRKFKIEKAEPLLMLPAGTDIRKADRVSAVTRTSDGAVLAAGPMEVKWVEDPSGEGDHLEAALERIE
jgi:hypothetical protein